MEQQNQQMNQQMAQTPQNRGGHELFDVHEILSGTIGLLEQFMMFRQYVKDPELLDILDRQHQFILSQYNITAECFSTGRKPSQETSTYMMKQNNDTVYGMKPSSPKKPAQSIAEINDECISGFMLGIIKSNASALTMASFEVTNPVVRRVISAQIQHFVEMGYELFLYQNKNGYYQVPQLSSQDMQTMLSAYAPATGQPQMPQNNGNTQQQRPLH